MKKTNKVRCLVIAIAVLMLTACESAISDSPQLPVKITGTIATETPIKEVETTAEATTEVTTEAEVSESAKRELVNEGGKVYCSIEVDTPSLEYPSGSAYLCMQSFLKYYGYDVSVEELMEKLPYQEGIGDDGYIGDPFLVFSGNPKLESQYGCNLGAVGKTIRKVLEDYGMVVDVDYYYNMSYEITYDEMVNAIEEGNPIIVELTKEMAPIALNEHIETEKHSLEWSKDVQFYLVIGYDRENNLILFDPMTGETKEISDSDFFTAFDSVRHASLSLNFI